MTPEDLAEFWRETADNGPRVWRIVAIVGVFGSLIALSADVRDLAPDFRIAGLALRLGDVAFFLLTGLVAAVRPSSIRRWVVALEIATMYVVGLTVAVLSPHADGIRNLYFVGTIQVEFAAAAFFTLPRRAFWTGAAVVNGAYVATHWRMIGDSPFAVTVSATLLICLLIAGASQHVVLSYKQRSFLQRRQLAASEERISTILRRITDAFFALDREWRFVYFNPEAESLLQRMQHSRQSLIGVSIWETFPNLVGDSLMYERFLQAATDGNAVHFEEYYPLMDAHLEVHAFPAIDGLSIYCHEISDRKRAEAALQKALEDLEIRVAERTAELRELMAHTTTVREAERSRISREIHDELGQILSALNIELAWLDRRHGETDTATIRDRVAEMRTMVAEAIASVRRIAADLRPSALDDLGLAAAVEWLVESVARRAGIQASCAVLPEDVQFEGGVATAVFRIVQEAVTNVVRHAQAAHLTVRVESKGDLVHIEVADDGVGFARGGGQRRPGKGGLGLVSMRERAGQFHGSLAVDSSPGAGTRVRAAIPLSGPAIGVVSGGPAPRPAPS